MDGMAGTMKLITDIHTAVLTTRCQKLDDFDSQSFLPNVIVESTICNNYKLKLDLEFVLD